MDTKRFEHAVSLRDSGRLEEAVSEFRAMGESSADIEERASLLGNEAACLHRLRRYDSALKVLAQERELLPRNSILRAYNDFQEASLHWDQGETKRCLRTLERMLGQYRDLLRTTEHHDLYVAIQVRRATGLAGLNRCGEARPLLEEARDYDLTTDEKGAVLYHLGFCYFTDGRMDEAKKAFLQALENVPQEPYATRAHFYLGIINSREGAHARALHEFESCLPHAEEGQIARGKIYSWLSATTRALGLTADAERYEKLGKDTSVIG